MYSEEPRIPKKLVVLYSVLTISGIIKILLCKASEKWYYSHNSVLNTISSAFCNVEICTGLFTVFIGPPLLISIFTVIFTVACDEPKPEDAVCCLSLLSIGVWWVAAVFQHNFVEVAF